MLTPEIKYSLLIFVLFVVPRVLSRWRLPAGITAFFIGVGVSLGLGWFVGDDTVSLLSTFGIISLFLFAGLDVDFGELRRGKKVLIGHIVVQLLVLWITVGLVQHFLHLRLQTACIFALALVTPSTGFILDSLDSLGLSDEQKFWVKSKAIATEIVALGTLFVVMQSGSIGQLGGSSSILLALVLVLPSMFRLFAKFLAPYAPQSEFAFLLMLAILFGMITQKIGTYYLVGAFLVGISAHRFQELLPAVTSEKMLHSMKVFAAFFIPFYFFKAGLGIRAGDLSWDALSIGGILVVTAIPFRLLMTPVHRRLTLGENWRQSVPVSLALIPTLVFGLVLAGILRSEFGLRSSYFGALVLYTVVASILPSFFLKTSRLRDMPEPVDELLEDVPRCP